MRKLGPVAVGTALVLALGAVSVVSVPPPVAADSRFTTLGESVSSVAKSSKSRWDSSTGISKSAWASALQDSTVKVGQSGRAFVVEPMISRSPMSSRQMRVAPVHTDIALADAFTLHSRPSSSHVIYLDFTGHNVTGSYWADEYFGRANRNVAAYDTDNRAKTFSLSERQVIIDTWSAVVEDYSMFDVDVTTAQPSTSDLERTNFGDSRYGVRVVITSENNPIASGCGCQGIAYMGVFNFYPGKEFDFSSVVSYTPAFAFARPNFSGKTISDVVSHEAGHTIGLSHDGKGSGAYYIGRDGWAPIMGAGYYEPLVQWSNGDYSDSTQTEDDFAVAQSTGLPLLADDYANTAESATSVNLNSTTTGVIGGRTDVDYFRFVPTSSSVDVSVALPSISPDLDVSMVVYDSSLNPIATANPDMSVVTAEVASGLAVSQAVNVTPGQTYYLKIDGVGFGSGGATGYSDYGSVGEYRVTIESPKITSGTPMISGLAKVGSTLTVDVGSWSEGVSLEKSWLRNGSPIGETGLTYQLKSADKGKKISVQVNATKDGFAEVTVTSATTPKVKG